MPNPNEMSEEEREHLSKLKWGEENPFKDTITKMFDEQRGFLTRDKIQEEMKRASMENIINNQEKIIDLLERINTTFDNIFGDHVLVDGNWMRVVGIARNAFKDKDDEKKMSERDNG